MRTSLMLAVVASSKIAYPPVCCTVTSLKLMPRDPPCTQKLVFCVSAGNIGSPPVIALYIIPTEVVTPPSTSRFLNPMLCPEMSNRPTPAASAAPRSMIVFAPSPLNVTPVIALLSVMDEFTKYVPFGTRISQPPATFDAAMAAANAAELSVTPSPTAPKSSTEIRSPNLSPIVRVTDDGYAIPGMCLVRDRDGACRPARDDYRVPGRTAPDVFRAVIERPKDETGVVRPEVRRTVEYRIRH